MPSQLNTRINEIKQSLLQLAAVSGTVTPELQKTITFLDKLASGQTLSGLSYVSTGLNSVSASLKQLGAGSSAEISKLTTELGQLIVTTRLLAKEANLVRYAGLTPRAAASQTVLGGVLPTNIGEQQKLYQDYVNMVKRYELIQQRVPASKTSNKPFNINMAEGGRLEEVFADKAFFGRLPFQSQAVENLQKKLSDLGLTGARVKHNVTELSTGITTLSFSATDAFGGVRQLTTHLDRAGNALDDTQKRFRTFGSAIIRDTVEVLKWSIAISLVYAPLRKMNELIQESIELQSALADIQIVTGKTTSELASVFEASIDVANQTGVSVASVLKGYNEAFAAASSAGSGAERAATAEALLRDTMVLSKLAGIDQAQALDTLVGALRQSGKELHQGQEFLDGWVAVSKNANVSLNQLASTFAIVGTSAEDVGISVHQLNGIVGALAESTKLSADETGNAIRGFISGFQSAKAETVLAKFGIAVRSTSGEVRSFTDLLTELAVLSQEGVLSQRDVGEITNVIGGGFRRGAQIAALLENYNRAIDLASISENAQGDAAEALGIQMSTLQSAIQRLNNAFSAMALTVGTEGGIISGLSTMVEIFTRMISLVERLTSALGAAAPALAILGLGKAVAGTGTGIRALSGNLPTWLAYAFAPSLRQQQGLGGSFRTPPGKGLLGGTFQGAQGQQPIVPLAPNITGGLTGPTWQVFLNNMWKTLSDGFAKNVGKLPGIGGNLAKTGLGGFAVPGLISATQLAQGDAEKAGISMGAAFLASVAGGSAIWVGVASVLASAFYDAFLTFEPNFSERWTQILIDAQRGAGTGAGTSAETRDEKITRLEDEVYGTLNIMERFTVQSKTHWLNFVGTIQEWGGRGLQPEFQPTDLMTYMSTLQQAGKPAEGGLEKTLFTPYGAPKFFDQDTIIKLQELMQEVWQKSIEEGISQTELQKKITVEAGEIASLASQTAENLVQKAIQDIATNAKGSIESFISSSRMTTQLALSASTLTQGIGFANEKFGANLPVPGRQEALDLMVNLTEDERTTLTQLVGEIGTNYNKINELLSKEVRTETDNQQIEAYNQNIQNTIALLGQLIPALQQAVAARQVEIIPIIDLPEGLSAEEQSKLVQLAEQRWKEILLIMNEGLTEEDINAYIQSQQEKLLRADQEILDYKTRVPSEFISEASQDLGYDQKDQFQFMDLREKVSSQNFDDLMTRYGQIISAFQQNVPGFELQTSPVTLILKDGFKNMSLDMRLLNLALQELVDIERKSQVEGIYNLPGGGAFYVPFDPAAMDAASRAGDETALADSLFAQYPVAGGELPSAEEVGAIYNGTKDGVVAGFTAYYGPKVGGTGPAVGPGGGAKVITEEEIKGIASAAGAVAGGSAVPDTGLSVTIQGLTDAINALDFTKPDFAEWFKDFFFRPQDESTAPSSSLSTGINELANNLGQGLSTKLGLDITSQIQLMVDGRVLAEIVKTYLYEDMVHYETTAGSVSKSVVI